ncbi:MAG: hypothetical protein R2748_20705 [Bryobacterales bacterium]
MTAVVPHFGLQLDRTSREGAEAVAWSDRHDGERSRRACRRAAGATINVAVTVSTTPSPKVKPACPV